MILTDVSSFLYNFTLLLKIFCSQNHSNSYKFFVNFSILVTFWVIWKSRYFSIADNYIENAFFDEIDPTVDQTLPSLKLLEMRGNLLSTIGGIYPPSLVHLYLVSNYNNYNNSNTQYQNSPQRLHRALQSINQPNCCHLWPIRSTTPHSDLPTSLVALVATLLDRCR